MLVDQDRLEERGSGYQQWAILCGLLSLSAAPIALIEEPESHLAWQAQHDICVALSQLLSEGPPFQLFAATHSPACLELSDGEGWYEVQKTEGGTVVTPRSSRAALESLYPGAPARVDGEVLRILSGNYIRLPKRAIEHIHLSQKDHFFCVLDESPKAIRLIADDEMDTQL